MARSKSVVAGVGDSTATLTGGHLVVLTVQRMGTPGRVTFNINAAATLDADDMITVPDGFRRIMDLGDHDGSIDIHMIASQASMPVILEVTSPEKLEHFL